jgi:hypothetical protein
MIASLLSEDNRWINAQRIEVDACRRTGRWPFASEGRSAWARELGQGKAVFEVICGVLVGRAAPFVRSGGAPHRALCPFPDPATPSADGTASSRP